jgi:hypothetical protein
MSSPNATNINPKDCVYGCNTRIYWNTSTSEYWEEFTKKKHNCPNRSRNNGKKSVAAAAAAAPTINNNNNSAPKPTTRYNNNHKNNYSSNYNHKKSWATFNNNKQPMDNPLEILEASSPEAIRKQYEVLTDLIKEYNGKIHGSQSHILANDSIRLIVYYEVPEGTRDEVKGMFERFTKDEIKMR